MGSIPLPRTAATATAPETCVATMSKTRRPVAAPAAPAGIRPWLAVATIAVLVALAFAIWLLWPREDKLAAVTEIQKQLLAGGGTPSRAGINRLIQTIDRMDRPEVWAAYRAAGEEWARLKQDAIDAYFAAPPPERPALLDAQIERLSAYHDLLLAMNPGERPGSPALLPRQRRGRGEPKPERTRAEAQAEKARRALVERFDEAVEARAQARRITLPAFR
jgi:hypothetical protein